MVLPGAACPPTRTLICLPTPTKPHWPGYHTTSHDGLLAPPQPLLPPLAQVPAPAAPAPADAAALGSSPPLNRSHAPGHSNSSGSSAPAGSPFRLQLAAQQPGPPAAGSDSLLWPQQPMGTAQLPMGLPAAAAGSAWPGQLPHDAQLVTVCIKVSGWGGAREALGEPAPALLNQSAPPPESCPAQPERPYS